MFGRLRTPFGFRSSLRGIPRAVTFREGIQISSLDRSRLWVFLALFLRQEDLKKILPVPGGQKVSSWNGIKSSGNVWTQISQHPKNGSNGFLLCSCAPQFIRYSWRKMDQIWPDGTCQTFQRLFSRSRPKPKPKVLHNLGLFQAFESSTVHTCEALGTIGPHHLVKATGTCLALFQPGEDEF